MVSRLAYAVNLILVDIALGVPAARRLRAHDQRAVLALVAILANAVEGARLVHACRTVGARMRSALVDVLAAVAAGVALLAAANIGALCVGAR